MADVQFDDNQAIKNEFDKVTVRLLFTGNFVVCGVTILCCDANSNPTASNLTSQYSPIGGSAPGFDPSAVTAADLPFRKVPGIPDPHHYIATVSDGDVWLDYPVAVVT